MIIHSRFLTATLCGAAFSIHAAIVVETVAVGDPGNAPDATVGGTMSASFYGTFDQAGNVREWNEAIIFGSNRQIRGGGFLSTTVRLQSTGPDSEEPVFEAADLGFRIATVPEPSAAFAMMLTGSRLLARRRVVPVFS